MRLKHVLLRGDRSYAAQVAEDAEFQWEGKISEVFFGCSSSW